jgi:hypothetical protein
MTLSRRSFLGRAGIVGAGALAPASARALMQAECGSTNACSPEPVVFSAVPKHLVVVIAKGGWDTTMAFDPKTDNPNVDGPEVDVVPQNPSDIEETVAFGRDVPADGRASPGPGFVLKHNASKRQAVHTFCERWWPYMAVINGMWTGSIVHQPCRIRLLTGTTASYNADFATIFGFERGQDLPLGSIDFSGLSYSGQLAASTGRIGFNAQVKTLLDPSTVYPAPSDASYTLPIFRRDSDEEAAVRRIIERRTEEYRALRGGGRNDLLLDDIHTALRRREALQTQGLAMVQNLNLGEEPSMDLQACVAADLLAQGLCSAVTLQHFDSWDTHKSNVLQHERYESFYGTLDNLMCRLQANGILQDTMVALVSEMGRTPRLNVGLGKDHWAHTTQVLIGAGVKGGMTYGGTNEATESETADLATGTIAAESDGGELIKYDNFVAGVLHTCNVDPGRWLPLAFPFVGATV